MSEWDGLREWCDRMTDFEVGNWDDWPDIDLYMDQVISYLERYMDNFRIYENEKMITPSIINNNTKDGVLPKPVKKKYSRALLSNLLMFCVTRQVLSGQELGTMLRELNAAGDFSEVHARFGAALERELLQTVRTVSVQTEGIGHTDDNSQADRRELAALAMELALQAFAAGNASRRILSLLAQHQPEPPAEQA